MPSEANRCNATRADGQPCRSWALPSGLCFAHDPDRRDQADQARRAGGYASARRERLQGMIPPRLVPVFDDVLETLDDVRAGLVAPSVGNAVANLARAAVTVLQSGELEQRVRDLEQRRNTDRGAK